MCWGRWKRVERRQLSVHRRSEQQPGNSRGRKVPVSEPVMRHALDTIMVDVQASDARDACRGLGQGMRILPER